MFGSEVMESFLGALATRYDVIIIDAPPMIVSDSLVLSRLANGTIFVVRWGRTRHDEMVAGLRQLTEHGAHVEGIVLTQVDARKYMKYGYTDLELSVQVYRKYSSTSHDVFRGVNRGGERLS
jgi:Mrp family chromosome partitioning ATPase